MSLNTSQQSKDERIAFLFHRGSKKSENSFMFPWPASHSGYLSSPPQPHQSVSMTHLSSLVCSFIIRKLVHVTEARRKYKQGYQSWGTPQSMCCPKRNQLHVWTLTLHLFLDLPSNCVSWKINLQMQHPLFKIIWGQPFGNKIIPDCLL